MNIPEKLRKIINVVYDSKQQALAVDLGVNPSTVSRWLDGAEIGTETLVIMQEKGININWLLNEKDDDLRNMTASNVAGQSLFITKIMHDSEIQRLINHVELHKPYININDKEIERIHQKLDSIITLVQTLVDKKPN